MSQNRRIEPPLHRLPVPAARQNSDSRRGPEFWRSLDEQAQAPEIRDLLEGEFPAFAELLAPGVSRRRFLQLASASLAFGGLTACTRQPLERIVPFVEQPESLIPGRPLSFASAMPFDGFARGVLVESHMGRPTKIEGNPDHPASRGATDLFAQASILTLYDPDRSQVVRHLGRIRNWATFVEDTRTALETLQGQGGARLRILTGTVTSPSLAGLIRQLLQERPRARWHQYSPVHRDNSLVGARAAFGQPVGTIYDLRPADVILSLDADFLTVGPASVTHAKEFASRRRVRDSKSRMNRLYAVESTPTATGTLADHRLPLRASEIAPFAAALAAELAIPGAGARKDPPQQSHGDWLRTVARDLRSHPGSSLVVPGEFAAPEVHVLAQAINHELGNIGRTVHHIDPPEAEAVDQTASLGGLVEDMVAGEVDVLLMLGGNPVYDAPADLDFAAAMSRVPRRIRLGLYEDETSELCHWHIPEAHYLESWGDVRAFDGTVSIVQPLIEPLYGGRSALELVAALTQEGEHSSYDLVRDYWRRELPADFERRWRRALHEGSVDNSKLPPRRVALAIEAVERATAKISDSASGAGEDLELVFRPDPTIWDGQFANNGWLQECPKPLTKLTWDNAALLSPALARRLAVQSTQVVELTLDGRSLEAPVWVQPGHPDNMVTLHLGYGRRRAGGVGSGTGCNAYALRTSKAPWVAAGLEIRPTDREHPLSSTQLHHNLEQETREAEKRHLVRVGTLAKYEEEPDFVQHVGHSKTGDISLYPPFEYAGYAWGLAVDLSACTGCNACVVACQSENNIPVVGKDMVAMGREMHWIRIDRYFRGDLEAPRTHHQPVMCMHCEQAPCEVVCPVGATVHSDEGLNDMVYNRCVGTRYCSNNCPYKVRRFNFLKYNDTETPVLKMLRNPDVTVRTRGVMEKCTYCVQRINAARIEAKKEQRKIRDGDILTACQQVCPSDAIVFGDLNDPESEVSRWKSQPLNYDILEDLGTRPRTSYLAKLTNPDPGLEGES